VKAFSISSVKNNWLAKNLQAFFIRCLYVSVNVIVWKECKYVDEALWPGHGGLGVRGFSLLRSNHASLPCICRALGVKYPRMLTHGRGCIGSSGNVRVGRLAIGLSWWNMGKLVFPGEWRLYIKSLQLSMWSSFKVSCLGYPNRFIHSFIHSKLKFAENWETQNGIPWITPKF
jgi:hypothetical protein